MLINDFKNERAYFFTTLEDAQSFALLFMGFYSGSNNQFTVII